LPVSITESSDELTTRDITAFTYAANSSKKGLDRVLEAWEKAHLPGERLIVAGSEKAVSGDGVESVGLLDYAEYRRTLKRTKVFITAPRREDYGISQLEALADGCMLVTNRAPGPYAALPIAEQLDPRLVGDSIGTALRTAIDTPKDGYSDQATQLLKPFFRSEIDRVVAEEVLPALLS